MEILEKILGGAIRVKMMRLFLFSPETAFAPETIAVRVQEPIRSVRRELQAFSNFGFIRSRPTTIETGKDKKGKVKRKRARGYMLNGGFTYVRELSQLLLNSTLVKNSDIVRRIQRAGKIKFIALAGIFIQNPDSRLDLFVVGDHLKKSVLENAVRHIESEIGKELKYASFETEDFHYRLSMYDKLVRDVLDFPHDKILNRLNI